MPRWTSSASLAEAEQQVLAAAVDASIAPVRDGRRQVVGNRPAQTRVVYVAVRRSGARPRAAARRGAWFRLRAVRAWVGGVRAVAGRRTGAFGCAAEYTLTSAGPAPRRAVPPLPAGLRSIESRTITMRIHSRRLRLAALAAGVVRRHRAQRRPRRSAGCAAGDAERRGEPARGAHRRRHVPAPGRRRRAAARRLRRRCPRVLRGGARHRASPALARRATEIGLATRQRAIALEAARLWAQLDPDAERAAADRRRRCPPAAAASRRWPAAATTQGRGSSVLLAEAAASPRRWRRRSSQLNRLLAHEPDKPAAFRTGQRAGASPIRRSPRPTSRSRSPAYIDRAHRPRQSPRLRAQAVDRALALKPGWERAVLLKAEILGTRVAGRADRVPPGATCSGNPASRPAAGALAQIYVEQKRYAEARAVFERLWDDRPQQPRVRVRRRGARRCR